MKLSWNFKSSCLHYVGESLTPPPEVSGCRPEQAQDFSLKSFNQKLVFAWSDSPNFYNFKLLFWFKVPRFVRACRCLEKQI